MLRTIFVSMILGLTLALSSVPGVGAETPTYSILLANADNRRDSVERNTREDQVLRDWLYRHVIRNGENWQVVDEVALTHEIFEQGRTRRSKDELITITRALQSPRIDVLGIYEMEFDSNITKLTQLAHLDIYVSLELIDLATGQVLGSASLENFASKRDRIRPDCLEESRKAERCRGEHIAKRLEGFETEQVAGVISEAGAMLAAQMIEGCGRRTVLRVELESASTETLETLQSELVREKCVESLDIRKSGAFSRELDVSFGGSPGQLASVLNRNIKALGLQGPVRQNTNGDLAWSEE